MALRFATATVVCLAVATCPTAEASFALPLSAIKANAYSATGGGGGGGGGSSRGGSGSPEKRFQRGVLTKHATRGCFVLCMTPSSLAGNGAPNAASRRRAGFGCHGLPAGAVEPTSPSVRRTRSGVFASQPLGSFLNRQGLGGYEGALIRGGGGGGDLGGARSLKCGAKEGGEAPQVQSRFRRVFDRMRGRAPAPVSAATTDMIYDTKVWGRARWRSVGGEDSGCRGLGRCRH